MRTALGGLPLAVLVATPHPAGAQEPGSRRAWSVEPSVSLRQIFTDNHRLQADNDKSSDGITEGTAGIRVIGNGARVQGYLDYALIGTAFARNSEFNDVRNALNALASAELVDSHVFVDVRGSIGQQAISAFGTQSPDASLANDNRAEVATVGVSPYVVGRLGNFAEFEGRLNHDVTRTDAAEASDVTNSSASLGLDGGGARLGWTADISHHVADFEAGRSTEDTWARAGLRYAVTPQWLVGATAGRESNNFVSVDKRSSNTWGVLATWTPSERTRLAATFDRRFFGNAHSLSFEHRTPLTVWTFVDSRGVSTGSGQGSANIGTAYDLYFRQLASVEPDPVLRDVRVRSFLQANGIDPNAAVIAGFLASAATVQRTRALSVGLLGARNTLTLRATQSTSQRIDTLVSAVDDLSGASTIRQRGLLVDLAHRLTPLSTVNLTGSYSKSTEDSSARETELKSLIASWIGQLGIRSDLLLGARHVVFDSTASPYKESAVFATYRLRF